MSDSPNPAVLEIRELAHFYGNVQALDSVTFRTAQAEFTVLLGPNGAGKTTLFSLITGLYHSNRGQVLINSYDIRRQPSKALRQLGVVFQQRSLDVDLTVWQNIKYSANLYGISSTEAKRRATLEMERLNIYDRMHSKIRTLSGGQARRVEIVRALINQPKLLVLDEPTVGLDVESRNMLIRHVRGLCKQNVSVLWTTHLLDEIEPDDHLVVLKKGKVSAQGKARELTGTEDYKLMKKELTALL